MLDDDRDKSLFESKSAFRLIYNGKVLTNEVPGCSEDLELCDVKFLLNRIEPIAVRKVDCDVATGGSANIRRVDKPLFSTTWGVLTAILAVGIGAFAGATIVTYKLTGNTPKKLLKKPKNYGSQNGNHHAISEQIGGVANASPTFMDPHEADESVMT